MKYIIVGYDRNRAIGANGDLPWQGQMKTDMKFVRDHTTGNAIIMGRKTFDSIGHALPNRQNIVVTRSPHSAVNNVTFVESLEAAYDLVDVHRDTYIFGGGQIYALALDSVDEILATEIDAIVEGADAFFPDLDDHWQEISREHHDSDDVNKYSFDFVTYKKSS